MIQRIQSIFLLIVCGLMVGFLFVPIWEKADKAKGEMIVLNAFSLRHYLPASPPLIPPKGGKKKTSPQSRQADKVSVNDVETKTSDFVETKHVSSLQNTYLISGIAILSALVACFSIFKFKKRPLQLKLGMLNTLLLCSVLGTMFYYQNTANNIFDPEKYGQFKIGFFLPVIALLFNILANKFIRKDEKLVRSVERMR
ncbi:MAG: DUF4293 domain-containing protein [Bacteroidetes bacterium]|nr:DUF4293 domain-containing protein [Bacteroidota bacterium]